MCRRVDYVLCGCPIHLVPPDTILQAGVVYLSIKTTVDDIEWLDSGRVKLAIGHFASSKLILCEFWKQVIYFPHAAACALLLFVVLPY